jgi:hypothetical protein
MLWPVEATNEHACAPSADSTLWRVTTALLVAAAGIAVLLVVGACVDAFLRWGGIGDLGWDAIIEVLLATTPLLAGRIAFRSRVRSGPRTNAVRYAAVVVLIAAACSLWLMSVMNSNLPSR